MRIKTIVPAVTFAISFIGFLPPITLANAAEYDEALNDVEQVRAVFDYTQASATTSNVLVWPIEDVYKGDAVNSLSDSPMVAVVFHGPAVKLLSTDASHHDGQDAAEVKKFQNSLTQMKEDGAKLEVCSYALEVMGVDPDTVIPAVNKVPNGFVSVVGYQAQDYEVVRIP